MRKNRIILIILIITIICSGITFSNKPIPIPDTEADSYLTIDLINPPAMEPEYIALAAKLEDVLSEKNYDEDIKQRLRDILLTAYTNYDLFESIYALIGVPSATDYLTSNYIDLLKNKIDTIKVCEPDEMKKMVGRYTGGTYINRTVYILSPVDNYYLMHEIYHSGQSLDSPHTVYKIFVEGSAESCAKILTMDNYKHSLTSSKFNIPDLKKNFDFEVAVNGSSSAYAFYHTVFEKIRLMAGYEATEQCLRDGNIDKLIDIVDSKYENNIFKRFLSYAQIIYTHINFNKSYLMYPDYSSDEELEFLINLAIQMEVITLNCMKSIIENSVSQKEISNFFSYYRNYKMLYLTSYVETITAQDGHYFIGDVRDRTEEIKEIYNIVDNIDKILIDKIIAYNVFPQFSSNPSLNVNAIKSLLYVDRGFYRAENIDFIGYSTVYPFGVYYKYEENDSSAVLTISNKHLGYGLKFTFDTQEIISVVQFDNNYSLDPSGFKKLFETNHNSGSFSGKPSAASYSIISETFSKGSTNVQYPQINGLPDKDKEDIINDLIKNDIWEKTINPILSSYEKDIHEDDEGDFFDKLYSDIKYEVTFKTDELISIFYTYNMWSLYSDMKVGSNFSNEYYAVTIDIINAEKIKLTDMISVDESLVEKIKKSTEITAGVERIPSYFSEKNGIINKIKDMDNETIIRNLKTEGYYICDDYMRWHYPYTFFLTADSLVICLPTGSFGGYPTHSLISLARKN